MSNLRTSLTKGRLELVWGLLLLLAVMAGPRLLAPVEAQGANCYYDSYFNWCFDNHLPLDCLCYI